MFEGVFLFVILIPIINNIVEITTLESHLPLYNNVLGENLLLQVQMPKPPSINIYNCKNGKYDIFNPDYINQSKKYNNDLIKFASKYNLDNIKDIFTNDQKSLLQSCVNKETNFLEKQLKVPLVVYIIIILSLIALFIIILLISKKFNIPINYKFSIINSIIVFVLICGYASLLLWYSVFAQPYILNVNNSLFKSFLDYYNSV
jgi:hypothetical protein